MKATCVKPASPLAENAFSPNQSGKLGKELIETLADAFDLPKSAVRFVSGETGKQKRILLAGLTAATLRARLGHL